MGTCVFRHSLLAPDPLTVLSTEASRRTLAALSPTHGSPARWSIGRGAGPSPALPSLSEALCPPRREREALPLFRGFGMGCREGLLALGLSEDMVEARGGLSSRASGQRQGVRRVWPKDLGLEMSSSDF